MSFEKDHVFHEEDSAHSNTSDEARIFNSDELAAADTGKINGEKTVKIGTPEVATSDSSLEQISESPKSLFVQAYEKIRNTDKVSNVVDNISIWWKGRHIDAIEVDMQRLERLARIQEEEAGKHDSRLQASDQAAAHLAEMKQGMNMQDSTSSHVASREEEYAAVQSRSELHRTEAIKLHRELAAKRELKAQFEQARDDARNRIAQRFQNNIETSRGAIQNLDGNIDDIQKNLGVAETILTGLRDKQEIARSISGNPEVLSADKLVAQARVRDLEGRIQDMQSKMQLQKDRVSQYVNKKAALETQKAKWETRITKKAEQLETKQDELSNEEKIESFAQETERQIGEHEDAVFGEVEILSETNVDEEPAVASIETEKDPRVALLEDLQQFVQDPDMKKYNDPDFQELVLEQGTPEQKALLKANGYFTSLFSFLESRAKTEVKKEEKIEKKPEVKNVESIALAQKYDDLLDEFEDDPSITSLLEPDRRKEIELGAGTSEEQLLVKLLNFFEYLFKSLEIRPDAKKSEKRAI